MNFFEIMFQYLNIRDALMGENIRALLYQQQVREDFEVFFCKEKQILYKDLNVPPNEFVHNGK